MKKILLILLVFTACGEMHDWTENTSIYSQKGVKVWMDYEDQTVTINVTGAELIGGEIVLNEFYIVNKLPFSFTAKPNDSFRVTLYLIDNEGNKHNINTMRRI